MSKLVIMDEATGEVMGDYLPKKKRHARARFLKSYYIKIEEACRRSNAKEFPLSLRMASVMDSSNIVRLDKPTKERVMNFGVPIGRTVLFEGLKQLVTTGFILPTESPGQYMVNPNFYERTNQEKGHINLAAWEKLIEINFLKEIKKRKLKQKRKEKQRVELKLVKIGEAQQC